MKEGFKKKGSFPIVTTKKNLDFARATIEEIAETSLNHYLEGFRKGGYQTDDSQNGWQERRNPETGRAILVKSGALRNDLDVLGISSDSITLGTKRIPYAAVHNEGGEVPERRAKNKKALKMNIGGSTIFRMSAAAFTMPQREFLGHSKELNEKNIQIIKDFFDSILTSKK